MVPRQPLTTIPKYDEMVTQQGKLSSNNTRPETNVVPHDRGSRVRALVIRAPLVCGDLKIILAWIGGCRRMRSRRSLGPKDMYLSLTVDEGQKFAGVDGKRIRLGVPRE